MDGIVLHNVLSLKEGSGRVKTKCSKVAFDMFIRNWDLDSLEHIEEFKHILLTRSNIVLGVA